MTKTQYVIISKKQLDEAAEAAADKTILVNELKQNHDVVPGDGRNFILCGHGANDEPFVLGMDSSLDWEFLTALKDSVDEEFDHASDAEKAQIRSRIYSDVCPDIICYGFFWRRKICRIGVIGFLRVPWRSATLASSFVA